MRFSRTEVFIVLLLQESYRLNNNKKCNHFINTLFDWLMINKLIVIIDYNNF